MKPPNHGMRVTATTPTGFVREGFLTLGSSKLPGVPAAHLRTGLGIRQRYLPRVTSPVFTTDRMGLVVRYVAGEVDSVPAAEGVRP